MLAWIFVGAERQVGYGSDAALPTFVASVVLLHLALGYVLGRWWTLVLPLLAVLVAVPTGYPDENRGEPFAIWFALAVFGLPLAVVSATLGVLLRRLAWRRGRLSASAAAGDVDP